MNREMRNPITLTLHLHSSTLKAVKVSETGDERRSVWLPQALIEMEEISDQVVEIRMEERLALEKGLI